MSPWPIKPLLAIATFSALIAAPQFVPQFHNWRVFEWSTVTTVLDFKPRHAGSDLAQEIADLKPEMVPLKNAASRIQDPSDSLAPFFAALYDVERRRPNARVRILHYGDSPTTADLITADVRNLLQTRFGDAGHGVHLIAKPWAWYQHRGFEVDASGWTIQPATLRQQKDGRYGVGGVSFMGSVGAHSRFIARRPGYTLLRVSYLAKPDGGEVAISADGEPLATLRTAQPEEADSWQDFALPADARTFELRVTSGTVRLFCVSFEKEEPGVLYDSIGLNGSWAGVLATYVNERHWAEQMQAVEPDLVIINYGTNESGFPQYIDSSYAKDMRIVLQRVRRALPHTPILVMTPMDRGQRQTGGVIGTIPGLQRVVAIQSQLAAETGAAFFNTFEAMGGPGTMGRWYAAEPRLVSADFIHPMPSGARIVGGLLYQALFDGYTRYKLRLLHKMTAELRGNAKQ